MVVQQETIPQSEVINIYDQIYSSSSRLRDADALYRWVLKLLRPKSGMSLLDVACGEGVLVKLAQEQGLRIIGIDIAYRAASIASRGVGSKVIMVANGENLPFKSQSFDFVTNLGSLEHFADVSHGIYEMHRVMQPDGQAAILLPNSYYLADIVWHVWRTGYSVSHRQPIERFATYGEWRNILEESGLHVEKGYKYNFRFPRTRSDWRWYTQHVRKLLYLAISPIVPFNLSYSFLYICRKA
jgi:ubiquinone/menaquinone biosynthesis C-methylase UbiE